MKNQFTQNHVNHTIQILNLIKIVYINIYFKFQNNANKSWNTKIDTTLFLNSITIYIINQKSFISIKHFVKIMKIFANTIAIFALNDKKSNYFFIFFVVLLIDFFIHEHMYQQTIYIDCKNAIFFFSWTFVTINFHIELKSKYFNQNELTFSQNFDTNSYFVFCFLDNNDSTILFILYYDSNIFVLTNSVVQIDQLRLTHRHLCIFYVSTRMSFTKSRDFQNNKQSSSIHFSIIYIISTV